MNSPEAIAPQAAAARKHLSIRREWLWILVLFLVMRLVISGLAAGILWNRDPIVPGWMTPQNLGYQRMMAIYADPNPATRYLLSGWIRWDTGWFIQVAEAGYAGVEGISSFLPLYPALIRLVELLTGWNGLLAALVVANLFCIIALILFYEVARMELGVSGAPWMALLYLVTFPAAFFLFAGYSEALFLTLALAAWLFARRGRWGLAALASGLAALTRLQGIALAVPLAWLALTAGLQIDGLTPAGEFRAVFSALRQKQGWQQLLATWRSPAWAAALAPILAVLIFNAALKLTGVATAISGYATRSSPLVFPWQALYEFAIRLFTQPHQIQDYVDLVLLVLFAAVTIAGVKKLAPALTLFSAAILLMVFSRSLQTYLLPGFMRFVLTTFPLFLGMAKWNISRPIRALILPVFLLSLIHI